MGYELDPRCRYRMPTHFGPAPGPRQKLGGGSHAIDQDQRALLIWASFAVDRAQIGALLPPGFIPADEADLSVEVKTMTNIGWLAGRGYSVVTLTTGVVWTGGTGPRHGRFKLVLWENMADPIITGREELGYPKLYAEIGEVTSLGGVATASASWDGFEFLTLEVSDLSPSEAAAPPGGDSYHLHYMPRVGRIGSHQLAQVILTPKGQGALSVVERAAGRGAARFTRASWRDLPTLAHVVDRLAELDLGPCRSAGRLRTAGTTDLSGQEVVAEMPDWTSEAPHVDEGDH